MKDLEKFRKKKEKVSAYEIYRNTEFTLWPVVVWCGNFDSITTPKSKREKLLKALNGKPQGLYFFTPGDANKIEIRGLSGTVISNSRKYLGQFRKVESEFNKKYGNSEEWYSRVNSRLRFLGKVLDYYKLFLIKDPGCMPLETMVYFAAPISKRPSKWLAIDEIMKLKMGVDIIIVSKASLND